MSVIVFGAAGFVGSHLVDRLVERGEEVLAVDDLRAGRIANLEMALTSRRAVFVYHDDDGPLSADVIDSLASAPVTVYDVAGENHPWWRHEPTARERNARLVVLRTLDSPYAAAAAELPGASLVSVSNHGIYGPRMNASCGLMLSLFESAAGHPERRNIDLGVMVAPVYVKDVVEAAISVAEQREVVRHVVVHGQDPVRASTLLAQIADAMRAPSRRRMSSRAGIPATLDWLRENRAHYV